MGPQIVPVQFRMLLVLRVCAECVCVCVCVCVSAANKNTLS
jgi:hypothetical protein